MTAEEFLKQQIKNSQWNGGYDDTIDLLVHFTELKCKEQREICEIDVQKICIDRLGFTPTTYSTMIGSVILNSPAPEL